MQDKKENLQHISSSTEEQGTYDIYTEPEAQPVENSIPTGKLLFQFDGGEPQELAIIHDYSRATLELHAKHKNDDTASIEFRDGERTFRIYIEPIKQDGTPA